MSGPLSSIMNVFRTQPATQTDPNAVNQQVPLTTDNKTIPTSATPKSDGSLGAIPKAPDTADKSPLGNYQTLWDKDKEAPAPKTFVPTINVDTTKLMEAARGIDFTKAMDPATLELAGKGDSVALGKIVNAAAQAGLAQAMQFTGNVTKAALEEQARKFESDYLPEMLRKHNISNELRSGIPIFENPAVAPLLSMLEKQVTEKYPAATPAEIKEHAKTLLSGMSTEILTQQGKTIVDAPSAADAKKAPKSEDWPAFFGMDIPAAS